jgi:hypothetical protein
MAAPYRSAPNEVLARFPLRSYPTYVMGIGVSIIAVLLMAMGMRAMERLDQPEVWAALVAAAAIPFCVVRRMSDYRIAGGAGELRLLRDRVEVPHPDSPEPIRMPLAELRVQVPARAFWINGVKVRESQSLILSTRTDERVLACEVFASSAAVLRAANAIRRLQRGLEIDPPDLEAPEEDCASLMRPQAPGQRLGAPRASPLRPQTPSTPARRAA